MALDESNEDDSVFNEGGFSFCVNKELLEQIKSVEIKLTYMGFMVEPGVPLSGGGSACGGCASSGSCAPA